MKDRQLEDLLHTLYMQGEDAGALSSGSATHQITAVKAAERDIRQLIASELNDRMAAHYAPELKTFDYDGIAESMIEWLGELGGGEQ